MVLLPLLVATLPLAAAGPLAGLRTGHAAFQSGDYAGAARALEKLPERLPQLRDHVLYLAAESEFYAGRPARARVLFERLAAERDSRFAPISPWRAADCLWAEGRRSDAGAAYRRLLKAGGPPGVDPVVARFRLAELAPAAEAGELYRQIHIEHPAHPLADEAARRGGPAAAGAGEPAGELEPRARLRRAQSLARGKRYRAALAELAALPPELSPELAVERDLQIALAKFNTRRHYGEAAALLEGLVPRLDGERAAFAAFYAARALSRAHREDEAITAHLRVVERFPDSRHAAEAQFSAAWLQFNGGRYRECVKGLRAVLERHRKTGFANDAAWYLALAHHFNGDHDQALAALEEYVRLSGADAEIARRAAYWRGRFLAARGSAAAAREAWSELVAREPLSWYGLLAHARLRQQRHKVAVKLPPPEPLLPPLSKKALRDPAVVRADELDQAGLTVEAGVDLQRSEQPLQDRLGREQALAVLLARYPRFQAYRRAYQLAETRGAAALKGAPAGPARTIWEAAYPRAHRELVEKHARAAQAPPLFVWSIMHKESGFAPQVASRADARGLLQLLPSLAGELVVKRRDPPFFPDQLFLPEVNIRLGARHLGQLLARFRGQTFLVAGAYNGGVAAMTRWLDRHGRRPLDEFVELVGFKESREYIKRVSAIHAKYTYLYTGKAPELPLTVNAAYRRNKKVAEPARALED
jgi:soluble lytic murein transglycosylase